MLSQAAEEFQVPFHSAPFMWRAARVILALCTGDGARLANVPSTSRVQRLSTELNLAAMGASTVVPGELHWTDQSCPVGRCVHTLAQDGKSGPPNKLSPELSAAC